MFNRVFYSPARSPCSRAALRMIAVAPKGPSSAVRAAALRAFVTEVFAPSLLLPASRQSGHLPPRGNSTAYVLPCGMPADDSRNRLHGGTATPPVACGYGKKLRHILHPKSHQRHNLRHILHKSPSLNNKPPC